MFIDPNDNKIHFNDGDGNEVHGTLKIGTASPTTIVNLPGVLNADGGLDRSTAAVLAIGGTNATAVAVTPVLRADGNIDRSTPGPLTIGATNVSVVVLGKAGAVAGSGVRNGASRNILGNKPTAPVDASANVVATVTQVLEAGFFTSTGTASVTLPTAQSTAGVGGIVAGLPGTPAIGDIIQIVIACLHATQVVTLIAGTGSTIYGIATGAVGGGARTWTGRITGITADSQTMVWY